MLLEGFDLECPGYGMTETFSLYELEEALADWQTLLAIDIPTGDAESIHSDRCHIQRLKEEIRELKKIRGEQRGRQTLQEVWAA